jgi:hypothetical protein
MTWCDTQKQTEKPSTEEESALRCSTFVDTSVFLRRGILTPSSLSRRLPGR